MQFDPTINCAIHFHPNAFLTSDPKLMGRQAAGEAFLKAFFRYSGRDPLFCYTSDEKDFRQFVAIARDLGKTSGKAHWARPKNLSWLFKAGCLFHPTPNIVDFAWERRYLGSERYSLCGITHTTCTRTIMDALFATATAPLEQWDAIICTSQSVKQTVEYVMESAKAYFGERGGVAPPLQVNLPVIPLGVECEDFVCTENRSKAAIVVRAELGIDPDAIVVLYAGRLNPWSKANPLAMLQALETSAKLSSKRIHLVQSGWFGSRNDEEVYRFAAKKFSPSVICSFVDGRLPFVRENIWHAADIFVSLVDNIQETFGLTPLEAMAAGVPVIVSDWNGYRETVRDGIDGFCVPTALPADDGLDVAWRHFIGIDNYRAYTGQISQCTAVDIPTTVAALRALLDNAGLRRKMGAAGQSRANEFSWASVIRKYLELWKELSDRRPKNVAKALDSLPHPRFCNPFAAFAHYSTRTIGGSDQVRMAVNPDQVDLETLVSSPLATSYLKNMFTRRDVEQILRAVIDAGQANAADVFGGNNASQIEKRIRAVCWLAKIGVVEIVRASDH